MQGGGGCRKFEGFVGNLGGFAPLPPPPTHTHTHTNTHTHTLEKVNFRHCVLICRLPNSIGRKRKIPDKVANVMQ
jgi:hypothetical protein